MGNNLGIDILIQDERWKEIADLEKEIFNACKTSIDLKHPEILSKNIEISIVLSNDQLLHHLNKEYLKKDYSTNVLSFPSFANINDILKEMEKNPESITLGDIIISFEKCQSEATEQGKLMIDHLLHLIVHGLLHLLGYNHIEDSDAEIMEKAEIEILNEIGRDNPYNQ